MPDTTTVDSPIHEVFAYLTVDDAQAAMDFYHRAFGATEIFRLTEPGGRVGHAEMQLGPATLMIADEHPEYDILGPKAYGGSGARIHLHVDDCDAMARQAEAAGAEILMPPQDQFYGERSCRLKDPFGHVWLLGHSIEEVSPEEMQRRFDKLFESA